MSARQVLAEVEARARAGAGEHARTGLESMFTSSKAYNCIPKAPRGHPGLWAGPLAAKPWLRGPAYDATYRVIRDAIWARGERDVDEFTQGLFDYGNAMEPQILRWLRQLPDFEAVSEAGRLCHPALPWMSSTPDGLALWRGLPVVLELKAPPIRRIQAGPVARWARSRDGPFRQDNVVVRREPEEGGEVELVDLPCAWDHIRLVEQSLVPAHYLVQCTLHCLCAGLRDAVIVQAESGGPHRPPTLHVTHWRLDEDLLDALLPYWARIWALVEEGRARVRLGERLPTEWPWVLDGDERHAERAPFDWDAEPVRRLAARARGNI